jgi:hypothetical protein
MYINEIQAVHVDRGCLPTFIFIVAYRPNFFPKKSVIQAKIKEWPNIY